jgi:phenol 2-monooxygenase (NADPH)
MIVQEPSQTIAKYITVGKRFPPELILVAYDDKLTQIHDILPSDARFKVLVFTGDLYQGNRKEVVKTVADKFVEGKLRTERSYVGPNYIESTRMVDTYTIVKGRKGDVKYWDVPDSLYTHWTQ